MTDKKPHKSPARPGSIRSRDEAIQSRRRSAQPELRISRSAAVRREVRAQIAAISRNLGEASTSKDEQQDQPDPMSDESDFEDDEDSPQMTSNVMRNAVRDILVRMPVAVSRTTYTTVLLRLEDFTPLLRDMYIYYHRALFPEGNIPGWNIITQDDFVRCAQMVIKARFDNVFKYYAHAAPNDRVIISETLPLPRCLARVINGLGGVIVNHGVVTVYPIVMREEAQLAANRVNNTDPRVQAQYIAFLKRLQVLNVTTPIPLTRSTDGTKWWLQTVYNAETRVVTDGNARSVYSTSNIMDITPADVLDAHVIQSQHVPVIAAAPKLLYQTDITVNTSNVRSLFYRS